MKKEIKWIHDNFVQIAPFWYDDYISEDGTLCRRVWQDGEEEEIFKIG